MRQKTRGQGGGEGAGQGGEMSNRQGNPHSKPRVRGMEWKNMARWSGEPIPYLHPFFRMPVRPQGLGLLAPQRELTTLSLPAPPTPPHPGVHTLVWEVGKSTCVQGWSYYRTNKSKREELGRICITRAHPSESLGHLLFTLCAPGWGNLWKRIEEKKA